MLRTETLSQMISLLTESAHYERAVLIEQKAPVCIYTVYIQKEETKDRSVSIIFDKNFTVSSSSSSPITKASFPD